VVPLLSADTVTTKFPSLTLITGSIVVLLASIENVPKLPPEESVTRMVNEPNLSVRVYLPSESVLVDVVRVSFLLAEELFSTPIVAFAMGFPFSSFKYPERVRVSILDPAVETVSVRPKSLTKSPILELNPSFPNTQEPKSKHRTHIFFI
jgi:hypothetical protein